MRAFHSGMSRIIFILILCFSQAAWIDPFRDEVSKGNRSFEVEDFDSALGHYDKSDRFAPDEKRRSMLSFNKGAAEYRRGNYQQSIEHFKESLKSGDPAVQRKAYYNMGNSHVQLKQYDEAFDSYAKALKIDPGYENAKKNIEYLLQNREDKSGNSSDNKDSKDNKDDRGNSDKDKNRGEDKSSAGSEENKRSDISREQMKNMLESLKNKPVRRQKGGSGERADREKLW